MTRIGITLVTSLVGFSAFAADYQPKPADYNNGALATYPPKVEGYERPPNVPLAPLSPDTAKNSELAAYPLVPTWGGMMPRPMMR